MPAPATKLLVLGAVRLFEPVNGYQLRRELLSWGVDEWAHVHPGSIYNMLATLTKAGHVERHEVPEGTRTVAVYTTTPEGRAELDRVLGLALTTVDTLDPLPVHTALSMMSLFPRDVVLRHLRARVEALRAHLTDLRAKVEATVAGASPPHVARMLELQESLARVELDWLTRTVDDVADGALSFAGEPLAWQPPDDDPGWQMATDRERYVEALRRSGVDAGG